MLIFLECYNINTNLQLLEHILSYISYGEKKV